MFNKIVIFIILLLLTWLSNESLKMQKDIWSLNKQLVVIQKQLTELKKNNTTSHNLLNRIITKQESNLTNKVPNKKKNNNLKASNGKAEKKNSKSLHALLMQHLSTIDKSLISKNYLKAIQALKRLKKIVWKNREINKEKILLILSSIDSLAKKLKENKSESIYSTEVIKFKITRLNLEGLLINGQ